MNRWFGRIAWSVAAQGASSVPNFGLYAVMAWALTPSNFGRFVALMAVYHLVLALARSALFEPYVADPSRSTGRSGRSIALAAGGALAVVVVGLIVDSPSASWVIMALAMIPLLAQDGLRHLGWASGRPWIPLVLDLTWVVVFAIGLVAVTGVGTWSGAAIDTNSLEPLLLGTWVAGGAAGALLGTIGWLVQEAPDVTSPDAASGRTAPDPSDSEQMSAVRIMGRSQAIQSTAFNLLPLIVAVAISPSTASAVKSVLLPFTPILTTVAGTRLVTLPAMRQAVAGGRHAIDRLAVTIVGAGTGFALVGGLLTVAALTWLPLGAEGSALAYSRSVAWWGLAITTMSVVDKFLADALALGRRDLPVIPMRLLALAIEWAVLITVTLSKPEADVAVAWAVGLALGSMVWVAPTAVGRRASAGLSGRSVRSA